MARPALESLHTVESPHDAPTGGPSLGDEKAGTGEGALGQQPAFPGVQADGGADDGDVESVDGGREDLTRGTHTVRSRSTPRLAATAHPVPAHPRKTLHAPAPLAMPATSRAASRDPRTPTVMPRDRPRGKSQDRASGTDHSPAGALAPDGALDSPTDSSARASARLAASKRFAVSIPQLPKASDV